MKRFSIRDLLWLTVVIAILITWWATNRRDSSWEHLKVAGIHDTRSEVLIHDTNSKQYYVWKVEQMGETLQEDEAYKWDETK